MVVPTGGIANTKFVLMGNLMLLFTCILCGEIGIENLSYICISCKDTWEDRSCVVEHLVQGTRAYFCPNYEEWVENKSKVIQEGWAMLGRAGLLETDL